MAAQATWQALSLYRTAVAYPASVMASDTDITDFIKDFVYYDSQEIRSCIASVYYAKITGPDVDKNYASVDLSICGI